jgi:hypothetical protein
MVRLALVIGCLAAALLLAGGLLARGDPERTPVPAIDLRGETAEATTPKAGEKKSGRRSQPSGNRGSGTGGGGASPALASPPVPAGEDDDDDDAERDEDEDERDGDGDD